MQYLHDNNINAYIPDNQFRSRDPKFNEQKQKYGKRAQARKTRKKTVLSASEFSFNPVSRTCICPAGQQLSLRGVRGNEHGIPMAYFEGKLLQCRHCNKKQQCMHNPEAANNRKGNGRQVSFTHNETRAPTYTDWMTNSSGMNLNSLAGPERGSLTEETNNPG